MDLRGCLEIQLAVILKCTVYHGARMSGRHLFSRIPETEETVT
jgi:hypothetical protein